MLKLVLVIFSILLILAYPSNVSAQEPFRVICIGDSHCEPNSPLVYFLRIELGEHYQVTGHGRRGWTSSRWLRHRQLWEESTRDADFVFISLMGNDLSHGTRREQVYVNVQSLTEWLPEGIPFLHIIRPNEVIPRLSLGSDRVHLTRRGGQTYAKILAQRFFELMRN